MQFNALTALKTLRFLGSLGFLRSLRLLRRLGLLIGGRGGVDVGSEVGSAV